MKNAVVKVRQDAAPNKTKQSAVKEFLEINRNDSSYDAMYR